MWFDFPIIGYIDRVPSFYYLLKTYFSQLMQIWQLFIILKQPVHIPVTFFSNLTKLSNYLFIFTFEMYNRSLAKQDDVIRIEIS